MRKLIAFGGFVLMYFFGDSQSRNTKDSVSILEPINLFPFATNRMVEVGHKDSALSPANNKIGMQRMIQIDSDKIIPNSSGVKPRQN